MRFPKQHHTDHNVKQEVHTMTTDMDPNSIKSPREVRENNAKIDALLLQQVEWAAKIEADNELMISMVQEVKNSKMRFLSTVAQLDEERASIKAKEVDLMDTKLNMFLDNGMLSEKKRILLPASMRGDAHKTHMMLSNLATMIRANQLEILKATMNQIKEAEEAFIDRRHDDVEDIINRLRNLASASPCNVYAAEALMKNLPETLNAAVAAGSVSKGITTTTTTSTINNNSSSIDNNVNEVDAASVAPSISSSIEGTSKPKTFMARLVEKAAKERIASHHSVASVSSSASASKRLDTNTLDMRLLSKTAADTVDMKALGDKINTAMNRTISSYLHNVVKAHPLVVDMNPDLQITCAEEATFMLRDVVAAYLLQVQRQRKDGGNNLESIHEWVPVETMRYLRSTVGHSEVLSTVMVILTYVQQRLVVLNHSHKDKFSKSAAQPTTKNDVEKASVSNNKAVTLQSLAEESISNESKANSNIANEMNYKINDYSDRHGAVEYVETLDPEANAPPKASTLPRFMQPKGIGRRVGRNR